jgi:hypothetical protein
MLQIIVDAVQHDVGGGVGFHRSVNQDTLRNTDVGPRYSPFQHGLTELY